LTSCLIVVLAQSIPARALALVVLVLVVGNKQQQQHQPDTMCASLLNYYYYYMRSATSEEDRQKRKSNIAVRSSGDTANTSVHPYLPYCIEDPAIVVGLGSSWILDHIPYIIRYAAP
jgi:hypothetical protein